MAAPRLAPEVNRVLFVRNLPFKTTGEEMFEIFGKYGALRQVRLGTSKQTRGTAFVVFEDILDAKRAVENLTGFKVGDRYLVVLYYRANKAEAEPLQQLDESEPRPGEEGKRKQRLNV
jgi:pre-mRNA branch site protein p14